LNADGYVSTGQGINSANMYAYCGNNPINYFDPDGMCRIPYNIGKDPQCIIHSSNGFGFSSAFQNLPFNLKLSEEKPKLDPNKPPDHPDYVPPKKGDGGKVRNPNGSGSGWPAKNGGVWVPTPGMHGGEGWTVQYPGGGHTHAYPGGGTRHATYQSNPWGGGFKMIGATIALLYLVANNATGVGVADDALIPAAVGSFAIGWDDARGRYVCDCGESWY
jgi:hypothetical protein